jgi:outer membrane protein assembly factor BamB
MFRRGLAPVVLLILVAVVDGAPVPGKAGKEAWPVFRGDVLQSGVADAKLPAKLEVLWTFKAKDSIEGSAVVAEGVAYVASFDEFLYAVDLKSGRQKWRYKAGPCTASPAFKDGRVVVGNLDGVFHCIDAVKGTKLWTYKVDGEIKASATFAGDDVLFGCYGDDTLYCLTPEGKERWKFRTEGPVNGSVAVAEGHTFVAGCDSMVRVLDVKTGKEDRAVDLGGQCGAGAAVRGDRLYVGTMTGQFKAIDWKKGTLAWEYEGREFYASAAVTEDRVVVGGRDRKVHVLDRKTGRQVWTYLTRGNVDSSPVVAGGRIYVGSYDRHLYVLDLARGTLVQKVPLDGPIAGSPSVADGRVLIATLEGTLYCLGKK